MKLLKSKKAIITIAIIIILLVAGGILGYKFLLEKPTTKKVTSTNEVKTEFNTGLEEQYSGLLTQYFNKDYMKLQDYDNLAKYPSAYKDTIIQTFGGVLKILDEKDNHYKILVSLAMSEQDFLNTEIIVPEEDLVVIEGEYNGTRHFTEKDPILIYGIYRGNEKYQINGNDEILPKIDVVRTASFSDEFSQEELRTIAKEFFETPFTMVWPNYNAEEQMIYNSLPMHYIITLDNSTNSRFNKYRIYPSGEKIDVATETESPYLKRFICKTSDKSGFILSSYTTTDDFLELQVYDKDFKLKWTREFKNAGNYLYDDTNGKIALAIDNDLYIIDQKTGKDVVPPISVPKGNRIKLLSNGDTILVTQNAKDFIVYITADGKAKWKTSLSSYSGETSNQIGDIYSMVVANDKIYVGFGTPVDMESEDWREQYDNYRSYVAVFDKDGKEVVNTARG